MSRRWTRAASPSPTSAWATPRPARRSRASRGRPVSPLAGSLCVRWGGRVRWAGRLAKCWCGLPPIPCAVGPKSGGTQAVCCACYFPSTNTHPSCPLGQCLIPLPASLPPRLTVQAMRTRTERRLAAARADFMPGRQAKFFTVLYANQRDTMANTDSTRGQKELADNAQVLVRVGRPPLRLR